MTRISILDTKSANFHSVKKAVDLYEKDNIITSSKEEILNSRALIIPGVSSTDTVLENIYIGRHHLLRSNFFSGAIYWLSGAKKEEVNNRKEAEKILDFLEISNIRKSTAGTLSYGLRKRVELARAIAIQPELILLDEPMAGMNQEEKEDMARFIIDLNREWKITVVMIEHDMGVVMDISKRIAVLDFGEKIAEGTPDEVIKNKRVQQAYLGDES